MKILILGGDGMLGHQLLRQLSAGHDVRVTLRRDLADYASYGLFNTSNSFDGIDVRSTESLLATFSAFKPDAVINAVGIVKQRSSAKEAIPSLEINALLPHRLAQLCKAVGARLIQISTDCVFSGRAGNYSESSEPDAEDLYGRTKLLGEVDEAGCMTLRTSIIGRELARKTGLLEWFLAQRGTIRGFTNAIYSGLTTLELSRVIRNILEHSSEAHGLYHVSTAPISKHDLLTMIKEHLALQIEIVPDGSFHCDRSLNSAKFRTEFAYTPPSWPALVAELAADLRS